MTTSQPSAFGVAVSSQVQRGPTTFESMTVCRIVPGCDQS
jgi:hypothetical protein